MTLNLAILVGSNRKDSINLKLARALAKLGSDNFKSTIIEINDLPMFNQDLEADLPSQVVRFKAEVKAADAVLVVTPEYNRSIPAVLKNALDWASRPYGQNSLSGKPSAVTGTSPGALGAVVAQQHAKSILNTLNTVVLGQPEAFIQYKPDMVDANDTITDEGTRGFAQKFMDTFAAWSKKHGA